MCAFLPFRIPTGKSNSGSKPVQLIRFSAYSMSPRRLARGVWARPRADCARACQRLAHGRLAYPCRHGRYKPRLRPACPARSLVQARQRAPVSAPAIVASPIAAKAVTGLARPSVEPSRNVHERARPPTPFYVAPSRRRAAEHPRRAVERPGVGVEPVERAGVEPSHLARVERRAIGRKSLARVERRAIGRKSLRASSRRASPMPAMRRRAFAPCPRRAPLASSLARVKPSRDRSRRACARRASSLARVGPSSAASVGPRPCRGNRPVEPLRASSLSSRRARRTVEPSSRVEPSPVVVFIQARWRPRSSTDIVGPHVIETPAHSLRTAHRLPSRTRDRASHKHSVALGATQPCPSRTAHIQTPECVNAKESYVSQAIGGRYITIRANARNCWDFKQRWRASVDLNMY